MTLNSHISKASWAGVAALLAVCLGTFTARATTLDWNTENWTAGSLSQSFEIDSSNAGNDITITITGSTSRFNTNYPDDTTNLQGGLGATEQSLQLYMNQFANASEFVTVTITFNYSAGVDRVNFSIYDIDANNSAGNHFKDQIRNIKGIGFGVTNAVSITGSADNTVSNNNTLNASVTGNKTAGTADTAGTANALFNFGNAKLTSVSFDYGNGPGTAVDIIQWVGLSDIRYRPVPEVNPGLAAMLVCGCAVGARAWRRNKIV